MKTAVAERTKERPILFSGPMVQAILDERKSMTRRIINPQPFSSAPITVERYCPAIEGNDGMMRDGKEIFGAYNEDWGVACPYGGPGDRLWVRETFWLRNHGNTYRGLGIDYKAGGNVHLEKKPAKCPKLCKWHPSIHMPRWASRITLEITGVKVERLNSISTEDAIAEGTYEVMSTPHKGTMNGEPATIAIFDTRLGFAKYWDCINGEGSWGKNPWVWALSFKRIMAAA